MAKQNTLGATKYYIRNPATRDFLHMSGKGKTDQFALAWSGTQRQSDAAMIAAFYDHGTDLSGFIATPVRAFEPSKTTPRQVWKCDGKQRPFTRNPTQNPSDFKGHIGKSEKGKRQMKTFLLVIVISGQPAQVYKTQTCDPHMRVINEVMPHADTYCLAPSYKMRPVARPEVVL